MPRCDVGPGGVCTTGSGVGVVPPFAEVALWAAGLVPGACDIQTTDGCNWNAVPDTWRYAWSNLRLALRHARPEHRAMLPDDVVQQISTVHGFMEKLTDNGGMWLGNWHSAAAAAREILAALTPWLQSYQPGTPMRVPRANIGVRFPSVSGRSLQVSTDGDIAAAATLANGVELPVLGFGVWQLPPDGTTYQSVLWALEAGYRHIDTAQAYGNEHEVGRAVRDSPVPREEIRIVTKLSNTGEYTSARQRFMQQLAALGTDYVDVYMLHSPGSTEDNEAAWRQLEQLYDEGRIRALGVSNFGVEQLEELFAFARVRPVYLQNKYSIYHPGHYNEAGNSESLMEWLNQHRMVMTGYSIIHPAHAGFMSPMDDPHVRAIAERHGRTPSQVLHRWLLQLGAVVIPRSRRKERIVENSRLFDFALPDSDVRLLNGLATLVKSTGTTRSPRWCEDVYGVDAWLEE